MNIKNAYRMRDKKYYHLAHEGSSDLSHPAMQMLLKLFYKSEKVLDMGCGEGTRLATLVKNADFSNELPRSRADGVSAEAKSSSRGFIPGASSEVFARKNKKVCGIDVSKIAITLARKSYPSINFSVGNLENLPYETQEFDLLYSAYVFEHLTDPEKVLKEAFRVLKKGGFFVIIAPNFGAPNRRSPNSLENKFLKLAIGFTKDLFISKKTSLDWQKVTPLSSKYTIDADTTVEPYLLSLIKYCQNLGFKTESFTSNWEIDNFSLIQSGFKILGGMKMFPFVYWGPHLSAVFRK